MKESQKTSTQQQQHFFAQALDNFLTRLNCQPSTPNSPTPNNCSIQNVASNSLASLLVPLINPTIEVKLSVVKRLDQLWDYWNIGEPSAGVTPMKNWSKEKIKRVSKSVYSKRRKICRAIERVGTGTDEEKLAMFMLEYGVTKDKLNQEKLIKMIPKYAEDELE